MRKYLGLTKRNLLVYFKDKQSVFFSMLTPIIVFVLYILFLRDTYVEPIEEAASELDNFITKQDINMFVNGMLLTGILGSSMITVPYNSLVTIVSDRENRIDYDILTTPISRVHIILAYFTASAISAFIMSSLIMTIGLGIMILQGSMYLTGINIIILYGITLLGSVSSTALFMIIVLFFKSTSASGAFLGILSAGTGFVIGAYIPISQFSEGIQTLCNIFPGCGMTILYRNALLNPILNHMDGMIGGVDDGLFVESIKKYFVFDSHMFGKNIGVLGINIEIILIAALSIIIIGIVYPRIYQRR